MGSENYVIVDKWKLKFAISRYVEELDETIEKELDYLTNEEDGNYIPDEALDKRIVNIKLRDVHFLVDASMRHFRLKGIKADVLLLYWLKSKGIEYKILSEYSEEMKKYKKYQTISRW